VKYLFIDENRKQYPVRMLCSMLGVSCSGYYCWSSRKRDRDKELTPHIQRAYEESKGCYGVRRVWRSLHMQGIHCGRNRVARIMRNLGIVAKSKRKFRLQVSADHTLPAASNILDREFGVSLPDRAWVTDITCIWTRSGVLYLACVMDLGTRRIVGWSMGESPRSGLVVDAIKMAIEQRRPSRGMVVHSDRGSQYSSRAYRSIIESHGLIISMSGKGKCYDNAVMESFFATLKTELLPDKPWHTYNEARIQLYGYIELFYNRERIHSSLGYNSPAIYEASF